jgi:GMP synthase (glutamine-hydrolysing)
MLDAGEWREPASAGWGHGADPGEQAKKPILIVVHQVHSNPGHVGHWFRDNGYPMDIRRPYAGDPLPTSLRQHCGAVIFGGPQSANDADEHIRREIAWIEVPLREQKPFLGICLGAQMLAHHLGAKVDHCPNGTVEIGYHPVATTGPRHVLGALPSQMFQWHREGFAVPYGGVLLATSNGNYPNQAFIYGPAAVGVQFHPEITYAQVNRWSGSNPTRLLLRGARPRQEQLDMHLMHGPKVRHWLDTFLRRWVAGDLMSSSSG